jgi:hypothetical protein
VGRLSHKKTARVLDLGCGYRASLLHALLPHIESGIGVDSAVGDGFCE